MAAPARDSIKVVARFRPANALEQREGGKIIVEIDEETGTNVKLTSTGDPPGGFNFDRAFGMQASQEEIFEYGVRGIVEDVVAGYNGTVFAYGQTGSGKSFTMMGPSIDDPKSRGLIPRITEQIFNTIMESPPNLEYTVKVSYMEIYMERIRDLLCPSNDNLPIHEDKQRGVYVKNLTDFYVSSKDEVYEIMRQGGLARAVTATNMNAESSRSHSIFVITISQRNTETGTLKTGNLFLVDLAGSEKVGKTGASGQTLEEAKKINKSLSALGMVINALTDGKSSHIPYRDSKLTRILQESLGGNSRTTLIINCSPCEYNEAETISTLRFGMRAKSIKNKARINAELSPAELKALLKKAQRDVHNFQAYIGLVENELSTWRKGGTVDQAQWATMEKALGLQPGEANALASRAGLLDDTARPGAGTPTSGRATPRTPGLLDSRPDTPTAGAFDKDEREEFLKRENELTDQLAEKETMLAEQEKALKQYREELDFFKNSETGLAAENKNMNTEVHELKLQLERLTYESKEAAILAEATKEQNSDLSAELEELRKNIVDLKAAQKTASNEDRERKKAEKLAQLMGNFETGTMSQKEEEIRATLQKLDQAAGSQSALSSDDISLLRKHLTDSQLMAREEADKARQATERYESAMRTKEELEARVNALEQECDQLLDKGLADGSDEFRGKLEAQHTERREGMQQELFEARDELDKRVQETRDLNATIETLRSANDELKRAFAVTAAASEGGKDLAESARDMERIRKTMTSQLADFDTMKKSLMRDLQDRCEKVVELEISLDEMREQYNTVLRNSNSKAQQRKMEFLTRNLDQLALVQRQLVDQNSTLKREVALAEKRLLARNERIVSLETLLVDAQDKLNSSNARFEAQLTEVRRRMQEMEQAKQQRGPQIMASAINIGSRIARPLRGGGGPAQETYSPAAKSREAQRSSWFYSS